MSKLLFYVCVVGLLVGTVISASTGERPTSVAGPTCKSHGDPCLVVEECCPNLWCMTYAGKCVSKQSPGWREANSTTPTSTMENEGPKMDSCNTQNECCANTRCNKYAHRCQVIITEADLTKKKQN
ncbi:omega-conotoxin-like protein 1 [Neodiprion lecontei]|uniref:Omega-conotoxin-like protein 1 n=1 Tax=Neodiprion lecontei TaxID=441921 RepID=A0ABM3GM04_NEOLC|nr:omega-conotoxin-like protein 1 [Neodiprion lecontei]